MREDREFLEKLISMYSDQSVVNDFTIRAPEYIYDVLNGVPSELGLSAAEVDVAEGLRDRLPDFLRFIDNPYIEEVLRKHASRLMSSDYVKVSNIPIGLLPSRFVNAFAAAGDEGQKAIVLDNGITFIPYLVFKAYLCFQSWNDQQYYCSHSHPQEEYGRALVALAFANVERDLKYFQWAQRILGQATSYEQTFHRYSINVQLFILLHEYAHFLRGHLDPASTSTLTLPDCVQIKAFNGSQIQEFDADRQAFSWLERECRTEPALFFAGVLFRFMQLCETIKSSSSDSHPPAGERWKVLKQDHLPRGGSSSGLLEEVDLVFDIFLKAIKDAGLTGG